MKTKREMETTPGVARRENLHLCNEGRGGPDIGETA